MNAKNELRTLFRHQVDQQLSQWRDAALPTSPPGGWVRTIRGALGMSARVLAERAQIGLSGVQQLERSEAAGTISLASLRKLARALDCEVQYALVPRKPLDAMLMERARAVATAQLAPVAHSMSLESQAVDSKAHQDQIDRMANALVTMRSARELW